MPVAFKHVQGKCGYPIRQVFYLPPSRNRLRHGHTFKFDHTLPIQFKPIS